MCQDMPKNGSTFIATLTTTGRTSGRKHSKPLKAVMYNNKIYFSRHRPDSDWFKNTMANPEVIVHIQNQKQSGIAIAVIHDTNLLQKISDLKYPNQKKAQEKRVAVEVTLCGSG